VVEGSVGEREKGFFLASCGRHGCGIRVARLFGAIGLDAGDFVRPLRVVIIG
jgi:hypothetical protein